MKEITDAQKERLFTTMLNLEDMASHPTFDFRNYHDMANGFYQALEILGIGKEYVRWSENK